MGTAETNKSPEGVTAGVKKSQLITSDSAADNDEPKYLVNNKPVSREEYMKALPKAGWNPDRMPENFYPAISTE